MTACTVAECDKDNGKGAGGLCGMHTQRLKRTGRLGPSGFIRNPEATTHERIYSRLTINATTGCWEWQGTTERNGYGAVGVGQRIEYVHRWVYQDRVGPIPEALVIDHTCVNRACANPDHLDLVTRAENNRRGGHNRGERKRSAA